jgi:hypothetical protein
VANPIEAEEVTRTLASALANSTIKAVPGLIKRIIGEKLWQEREAGTGARNAGLCRLGHRDDHAYALP